MCATAALWFACAQIFAASPSVAKPAGKSKPKTVETREIKIRDDISVKFEAEELDPRWESSTGTGTGLVNYKGKVYISEGNPPSRILTSGVLKLGGKKIPLDVSGLADPWFHPEELLPRMVHVESGKTESGAIWADVEVFFMTGGAQDYLVRWSILDGASLRTLIEHRDYPADWQDQSVLPKESEDEKKEEGDQEGK